MRRTVFAMFLALMLLAGLAGQSLAAPAPQLNPNPAVTMVPLPGPTSFPDVPPGSPYYEAVTGLSARGIMTGYQNGYFGPDNPILRVEIAKPIVNMLNVQPNPGSGTCFPAERGTVDQQLWDDMCYLHNNGTIRGYQDGTVGPLDGLLLAQAVSVLMRPLVRYGFANIQQAADDPTIYPNVPASTGHRADIVTYVNNCGPIPGSPDIHGPLNNWDQTIKRGPFAQLAWLCLKPKS